MECSSFNKTTLVKNNNISSWTIITIIVVGCCLQSTTSFEEFQNKIVGFILFVRFFKFLFFFTIIEIYVDFLPDYCTGWNPLKSTNSSVTGNLFTMNFYSSELSLIDRREDISIIKIYFSIFKFAFIASRAALKILVDVYFLMRSIDSRKSKKRLTLANWLQRRSALYLEETKKKTVTECIEERRKGSVWNKNNTMVGNNYVV